jgi:diguanylate cyclase (GGDEF)-like protein/PAS domain S-box-containing protein
MEQLPEAVFLETLEGDILDVNKEACVLLGYNKEELLDMVVEDLVPEGSPAFLPDRIDNATGSGEPLKTANLHKDGTEIPVELRGRIVEIDGEKRMLVSVRDVTEQKNTDKALGEERIKLKSLHDAVDQLQQQDSEEDVLQTGVEVAENILEFEICGIMLLEGNSLVPKVSSAKLSAEKTSPLQIGDGIVGRSFQQGKTIWGNDVRKYREARPAKETLRAFICTPIGRIGSIQVISEEVGKFDELDVELVEILASHLREEIKRVRLEEELRQQAIHDPLTGLYNRRHFNVTLEKEVERCERYGHDIAFIMIDVNRFKEINDRYSHQTGDEVLKEVADLLEANVRDADTVVRYGGDEFLVVMPETGGDSSVTSSRLKSKLLEWNEQSNLLDFPLTLAMGVSYWKPDQERDVEDALNEADRKMYEDKDR